MTTQSIDNAKKLSHTFVNEESATEGVFLGRVQKYDVKQSKQNGAQYLRFVGDFEGRVNGKVRRSHVFYCPEVVEMELGSAVNNAIMAAGDTFKGVDFAVRIYKVDNAKSVTKYEWRFEHLLAPADIGDPLTQILSKVNLPALPSPVTSEETTEETPVETETPKTKKKK
jgi:hypothetical protein